MRKCSIRSSNRVFSLVIAGKGLTHCRYTILPCNWVGDIGSYKKAGLASHNEQTCYWHPCMAFVVLVSKILPCLNSHPSSFRTELQCGSASLINPLILNLMWSWSFITAIEMLTEKEDTNALLVLIQGKLWW